MPSVRVRENEYFDAALRRFKRACEKAGILTELRRREFYEKPTQERKRKKAAAIKRHMKRVSRDGDAQLPLGSARAMALKERITEDMKTAMRAGEKERLATIRLALAAIKQREVDERITPRRHSGARVLEKMIKQRRESVAQFDSGGRADLVAKENAEIALLQGYLPAQLSEAEHRCADRRGHRRHRCGFDQGHGQGHGDGEAAGAGPCRHGRGERPGQAETRLNRSFGRFVLQGARHVGRIPQHFIDELIARADIVEVIGARVPLKKAGREYKACCPFHNEKTPSFWVSPDKQFYHCFGCGKHGTVLGFLMDHDHLAFPEAVEELATRLGLTVPHEGGPEAGARRAR